MDLFIVMCEGVETIPKGSTLKRGEVRDILMDDDIVHSIWKHIAAVFCGLGLASLAEYIGNNEEGGKKIRLRHFSAVCNATKDQIIAHPEKAKEVFLRRGGHRMKLYDKAVITVEEIEKVCLDHNARIAVVDIGDKIMYRGRSKAGNGADALQGVYDNLREVVKRVNKHHKFDMLTTGQAGTTAENKRWLQQSDLYAGKTGKAGAFDYIIGMGWILDEPERRYISLCKNKLGTQSGRHPVNFHPLVARFSDA